MKKVLSLLMAFVFLQTQTWALSGGPDYTRGQGNSVNSLIGTYSGVLLPDGEDEGDVGAGGTESTATSIGLFSLTVPTAGLATGTAIIFVNGVAFSGNIVGLGDPDAQEISAVFSGQSNFEVITTPAQVFFGPNNQIIQIEEETSPILAQGSITAQVIAGLDAFSGGSGGTTTSTGLFTSTTTTTDIGTNQGARLIGEAEIETFLFLNNDGQPIVNGTTTYTVDGFKQSNTVTTTTTTFDFFF